MVAAGAAALGAVAYTQKLRADRLRVEEARARREADRQRDAAEERRSEAHDARILAGFRELAVRAQLPLAMKLLPEAELPGARRGWIELASDALNANALRATLRGHAGALAAAVWSPDGTRVLTASADGTARVWRIGGEGAPVVLTGHRGRINAASPDGARVVTASDDRTARVWRIANGTSRVLRGHTGEVISVAVSPDGARVVTGSRDRTARVFTLAGAGAPVVLAGHEDSVLHAAVSPDGLRVATASADRTVRVFRAAGDAEPVVLSGHALAVTFVSWRPDGEYVASASADRTARLWPADGSGPPLVLVGHRAPLRSASPDGARVVTAASDPWERSSDRTARVWSAEPLRAMPHRRRDLGFFHAASIVEGGERVVAAHEDRTARVFRVDGEGEPVVLRGHEGWVASAAPSADGARVATASFDRTARVWSADGKGEPVVLRGHEAEVRAAVLSPDGERVVTASDDGTARVWRADGEGEPVVLRGHEDWLTSAAWSPDGARVLTTSLDHTARVWRADGEPVVLRGHDGGVHAGAWSPDGERVVTASDDGTARVWSARGEGARRAARARRRGPSRALQPRRRARGHRVGRRHRPPLERCRRGRAHRARRVGAGHRAGLPRRRATADDRRHGQRHSHLEHRRGHPEEAPADRAHRLPAAAHARHLPRGDGVLRPGSARGVRALVPARAAPHGGPGAMMARDTAAAAALVLLSALGACGQPGVEEGGPEPAASAGEIAVETRAPAAPRPAVRRLGAGERRVKLLVLPADAVVEVDGVPVRRRDGVIELSGKVGQTHRVRVSRGARHGETTVTLTDAGASPPSLDLAALARAARRSGRGLLPAAPTEPPTAEPPTAEAVDAAAPELAEPPELALESMDVLAGPMAMESPPGSALGAALGAARPGEGPACVCPPAAQVTPRCPTGAAAEAHGKPRSGVLAGDAFE
ncbi:hypothetical protein BE20_20530 [Sorangium cellulosum]|nr:hypothetical protein BE20_20530 [Sorangium cellulosum]